MAKHLGPELQRAIARHLKSVMRHGAEAVAGGKEDKLHALRIRVKRLRYNLEFAAPMLDDGAREALALLALAQDRLGALADADTFGRTYAGILEGVPATSELRPGLERLCNDAARERDRALEAVRALWNGTGEGAYPEMLAASISAALGSLSNEAAS